MSSEQIGPEAKSSLRLFGPGAIGRGGVDQTPLEPEEIDWKAAGTKHEIVFQLLRSGLVS